MTLKDYSLKSKIFFFFILLLIAVQTVSFFTTRFSNERLEEQQLTSQLSQAETLLKNELDSRSYYLTAFVETAAKDYGLKQVLVEDTRSLLVALNNHRKRIDADIAIAFNNEGTIIGELVVKDSNQEIKRVSAGNQIKEKFAYQNFLNDESEQLFFPIDKEIYQLVITPLKNGDMIIGHIGFGYAINSRLANRLANLTGFSVGFGLENSGNWQWLVSEQVGLFDYSALDEPDSSFSPLSDNSRSTYIYANYVLGDVDKQSLTATTFQLRSNLIAAIKQDSVQLLLMIAVTLIMSLIGAYIIASGVTMPLRKLVSLSKDIAQGNYEQDINIGKTREFSQLADQFEHMQEAIQSREQEITEQAYLDSLTALPNRNQFYRDLPKVDNPFLLCQINIRRLSDINDTLGHEVGDEVIIEVANRLRSLSQPLYHTSGNGFLLRCDNETEDDIKECSQKINSVIEQSFNYQNIDLHLQVNIGVSTSDGWTQANQLLKEVDAAMQIAKRSNLLYQLYDRQIDQNTLDRLQLVNRLRLAIEKDEFVLFYQPKLNLQNNRIEEVEALVRWNHPVNGLITPDAFIQIADQTGQMAALSNWVLNKSIEQFYIWREMGLELKIAINISPENLLDDDFCQQLVSIFKSHDKLNDSIRIEITEDAFMDHDSKAVENINLLRKEGIYLSIDDYGTGYSSLAQLKNLPVQELKIDRCFVQQLISSDADKLIVRSTIQLSHQLGLKVVAEGVEDKKTLDWLISQGCEKAQGFYISRPLAADNFYTWLKQSDYSKNEEKQQVDGITSNVSTFNPS
ncbi:EAL domain-containing protein [Thalassotalea crassostreae]|uniref:bifunctional diguanylate cyclase/phosphodiesterase n=1 Tax=Thalassotalea crassostreae TaxID=1763536 RepID=UPI000838C6D6|nr:EAL domain-containing protein [Thalassotalea crassostreae]